MVIFYILQRRISNISLHNNLSNHANCDRSEIAFLKVSLAIVVSSLVGPPHPSLQVFLGFVKVFTSSFLVQIGKDLWGVERRWVGTCPALVRSKKTKPCRQSGLSLGFKASFLAKFSPQKLPVMALFGV